MAARMTSRVRSTSAHAGKLSFTAPTAAEATGAEENISDPAKPVPYLPRPVTREGWGNWLLTDQRSVDGRPDVLTYHQRAPSARR